ncbi:MAG: DUF389 domain-containing protein [Chloroflexota bacterium]
MTYPDSEQSLPPHEPPPSARARRRRARRRLFPSDAEGQASFLAALARRAYPSAELFIFAVLCGAVIGAGYLFNSQAILLFGVLLAPLLSPWVGLTIAVVTGSLRFFLQTLLALLISAALVFGIGLLAGFASRPFQPLTLDQVYIHSQLWWADLTLLALAAIILSISFVRSEEKPYLPSVMLAYNLFLPAGAAGFGLGAGLDGTWPQGALVFLTNLAWATLFGALALALMRFRSHSVSGAFASAILFLIVAAVVVQLTGFGRWAYARALGLTPTPTVTLTMTPSPLSTPAPASATPRPSLTPTFALPPGLEQFTVTPSLTPSPSNTPTPTDTVEPTPVFARIESREGGGAFMRETPNGKFLATLDNGVVVEVLGPTEEVNGVTWVQIAAIKNGLRMEGWIIQSVLLTATPVVNWEPSETPTRTATP